MGDNSNFVRLMRPFLCERFPLSLLCKWSHWCQHHSVNIRKKNLNITVKPLHQQMCASEAKFSDLIWLHHSSTVGQKEKLIWLHQMLHLFRLKNKFRYLKRCVGLEKKNIFGYIKCHSELKRKMDLGTQNVAVVQKETYIWLHQMSQQFKKQHGFGYIIPLSGLERKMDLATSNSQ